MTGNFSCPGTVHRGPATATDGGLPAAAVFAAKGRVQQLCIEPVGRSPTAMSTGIAQRFTVDRTTRIPLQLEQPAVIRRAHAAWTESQERTRVVGGAAGALAHDASGDAERSRDPRDVDVGGRDSLVGIDGVATQQRHHEVPRQRAVR